MPRYERSAERKAYRNGHYLRNLLTRYGVIDDIHVPRMDKGGMEFSIFDRYEHRRRDVDAANHYLLKTYLPAFNAEFMQPAVEQGSALVPWIGTHIDDILCEQYERTVSADNCVSFEGKTLQIPPDKYRCHYVRVKVRVHRYIDGLLAIFHGPRKLANYDQQGKLKETKKGKAA